MPLFGQKKDPAEEEANRARQQAMTEAYRQMRQAKAEADDAMFDWVIGAPVGDLAAHLMSVINFGTAAGFRSLLMPLGLSQLAISGNRYTSLSGPIHEAMQLLEHAELVRAEWDNGAAGWHATRLGFATLAAGKDAVRQRIKDRTGL